MALKIAQKPKTAVKDQLTTSSNLTKAEREAVDEIAQINAKLAPLKPLMKRFEELKEYLCSVALDRSRFDKDQNAVLTGNIGRVEFGTESTPREIKDKDGLIQVLKDKVGGYENLLPLLKINLGDIDAVLTEAEQAPYVGNKERGSRSIKSVALTK